NALAAGRLLGCAGGAARPPRGAERAVLAFDQDQVLLMGPEALGVGDAQRAADVAVLVGGHGEGGEVLACDDAVLLVGQRELEVGPDALVDGGELREVEDARGDERLAALAEDEEDAAAALLGDEA